MSNLQTPEHLQCDCGSGEPFERHHDGHGIYLLRSCDKCYAEKRSHFRADIFDNYDTDEVIDDGDVTAMDRADAAHFMDHADYGGAFDGFTVTSDADPGL